MKQPLVQTEKQEHEIAQDHGPVELSLEELQKVAGGLPRAGGWAATESTEGDGSGTGELPRAGGW